MLAGLGLTLALLLAGGSAARSQTEVRWRPLHTIPGILDVVSPRTDGRLIVASSQAGLFLLRRGSPPTPFARGSEGYVPGAGETYILQAGPRLEGGMAVAPRTFGRFAGQLIAPDEHSGRIFAFDRRGRTRVVSTVPLPGRG